MGTSGQIGIGKPGRELLTAKTLNFLLHDHKSLSTGLVPVVISDRIGKRLKHPKHCHHKDHKGDHDLDQTETAFERLSIFWLGNGARNNY
jgi:hypothetical protein